MAETHANGWVMAVFIALFLRTKPLNFYTVWVIYRIVFCLYNYPSIFNKFIELLFAKYNHSVHTFNLSSEYFDI